MKKLLNVDVKCCTAVPHYSLIDGEPEDFTEIAVSTSMLNDHFPDAYHREIHRLLEKTKESTLNVLGLNEDMA